jgi:hypothetical protein
LSIIPYADHVPDENYYRSIFNFCMALANLEVESQKQTSHGIIDIHINGSKGDDYILEFKYFSEKKPKNKENPTPPTEPFEIEMLRKKMGSKLKQAMTQINKKYAQGYESGHGRLIKIAIVIARRTFVLAKCEVVDRK